MEQFISSVHLAGHFKIAGEGVFSYTVQQLDVQPVSACYLEKEREGEGERRKRREKEKEREGRRRREKEGEGVGEMVST